MNEFAILHSVSGVIAGVQRGTGEWPFLTDMFDDNDLFSRAENRKQVPTKVNLRAALPLPVTTVREALEIDESVPSGLRWKTRPRHHFATERGWKIFNASDAGKPAGRQKKGMIYFDVGINGTHYRTHRIVYFLATGVDPSERHIDHIRPELPFPNVASNLRLATNAENRWNQKRTRRNKSGVTGVCWDEVRKKWVASIKVHGKSILLGRFNNFDNAVTERKAAEFRYFGAFAYDASRKAAHITEHP